MARVIVDEANAYISLPNEDVYVKVYVDRFEEDEDEATNLDIDNEYASIMSSPFVIISQDEYLSREEEGEVSTKSIERYGSMLSSVPISTMLDDGEPEVYAVEKRNAALPNVVTVTILDTEPNSEYDIEFYPREQA